MSCGMITVSAVIIQYQTYITSITFFCPVTRTFKIILSATLIFLTFDFDALDLNVF